MINWSTIASGLASALSIIQELAPAASAAGPEGATIGAIVADAAKMASGVLTAAEGAATVIGSNDLASIQASADAMQAINDGLAEQIAAS